MKNLKKLTLTLALALLCGSAWAQPGKIAIIADGNSPDPDDIGATSASIAMLRAFGLQGKLVHYSHSCDLSGMDDREPMMRASLYSTARKWGGFNEGNFFNFDNQRDAARRHLARRINQASSNNILYVINAGETDLLYEAMVRAQRSKRRFVRYVTHHPANDVGDFHDLNDILRIPGVQPRRIFVKRIPDQNRNLKKSLSNMHWARDHRNSKAREIWRHVKKAETEWRDFRSIRNKADISDAGMVWFWCTNLRDKNMTFNKFKNKINGFLRRSGRTGELSDDLSEVTPGSVSVYPNPTTDFVNIELGNLLGADISIFNMSGQLVFQKKTVDEQFVKVSKSDLLKSGNYILKILVMGVPQYTQKLIIK